MRIRTVAIPLSLLRGGRDGEQRGETYASPLDVAAQETRKLPCMMPECGSQTKR